MHEPDERDYREGIIILVILGLIIAFELYLRQRIAESIQGKVEICLILAAIGLIHLLGSHLLSFLYNCRHLLFLHAIGICRGHAQPRHARTIGLIFILAGVVRWFI